MMKGSQIHRKPRTPLPHSAGVLTAMLIAMIIASANGRAEAQDPDISSLRAQFEKELAEVAAVQERRYISELKKRELFFVEDGNYAAAVPIRDERLLAEQRLAFALNTTDSAASTTTSATPSGDEDNEPLNFAAADAERGGASRLSIDTPDVALLSTGGDSLEWDLPDLAPGGYEVEVEYACDSTIGGTLRIQETFFQVTGSAERTADAEFSHLNLGTLKIRTGDGPIRLIATSVPAAATVRIRAIHLRPAAPQTADQ